MDNNERRIKDLEKGLKDIKNSHNMGTIVIFIILFVLMAAVFYLYNHFSEQLFSWLYFIAKFEFF